MNQKRIKQGIKHLLVAVAPNAASGWQESRRRRYILVELHDQMQPDLTALLLERFQSTHSASLITSVQRDADACSCLQFSEPEKRRLAVAEFRTAGQQWAFLQAMTPAGTLTA